jgi:hypothetical protein
MAQTPLHRLTHGRLTGLVGAALSPVLAAATLAAPALAQERGTVQVVDRNITLPQVLKAQEDWCAGLLKISAAYASGGIKAAKSTAEQMIDQIYAYQFVPVAFKPTLASGTQTFRTTREGALAYFVGHNPAFPADKGFALTPWRSCKPVNQVIQIGGSYATTMGNVIFVDAKGQTTTVDKTWSFLKESNGSVRIVLHHSSLPFGS